MLKYLWVAIAIMTNSMAVLADDITVKTIADIDWGALNPARGDNSPKAGAVWGDRTAKGASGFLVQFKQGFSSPAHIHNVTYRGIVISGRVHNDDPNAEAMWLTPGSFWTQPAGEVHITAADGVENMAYIEIDEGPYLVQPTQAAFHHDEQAVNIAQSNLVWLDSKDIVWLNHTGDSTQQNGPKIAFLWGDTQDQQMRGTLLKLPAGYRGTLKNEGHVFHAVVIQGAIHHYTRNVSLPPGSYFGANDANTHELGCDLDEQCIVYVRTNEDIQVQ